MLTENERAALEQFRRHRRENPAGLPVDAWLRTPDAVTLADAMLRLFPPGRDDEITPARLEEHGRKEGAT